MVGAPSEIAVHSTIDDENEVMPSIVAEHHIIIIINQKWIKVHSSGGPFITHHMYNVWSASIMLLNTLNPQSPALPTTEAHTHTHIELNRPA